MSFYRIVSFDYSMTSPGACVYEGDETFSFDNCTFHNLTEENIASYDNFVFSYPRTYNKQAERFHNISDWAMEVIGDEIPDLIGIEDYSMGSKGKVFHIGENMGVLKDRLWLNNLKYITIPPTVIKKFATGKGNAKKEQMVEQFLTDTGRDLKAEFQPDRKLGSPTTDIVDAYYIAKYSLDFHIKNLL